MYLLTSLQGPCRVQWCITPRMCKKNFQMKTKLWVLMSNFNINLLKYDSNIDSSTFLDKMYSSFLFPYILSPSQLTTQSQMLIDNIFSNNTEEDINSGNIWCQQYLTIMLNFFFLKILTPKKRPCHRKTPIQLQIHEWRKIKIWIEQLRLAKCTTHK